MERYSKSLLSLNPTQIVVSLTRARKDFKNLDELIQSIQKYGLIHPIVVAKSKEEEGKYLLIAGERRFRAMCLLGWKTLPATDRDDLSFIERKEVELEENLKRENLSWPEEIELYRQIDEIKRNLYGSKMQGSSKEEGWTGKDTAEALGISKTNLYRQIKFAKLLKENPEYIKNVENLPLNAAIKKVDALKQAEDNKRMLEQGLITVEANLKLGDCRDLIKDLPDNSVDLLLTDIPYGIKAISEVLDGKKGHDSLAYKGLIEKSDNLSKEEIRTILVRLLPEIRRVLKPSSHFYIFHSFKIYTMLLNLLQKNDFLAFDVPLIWDKERTTNPFMGYEFQACYEPIIYGHVPPKAKRLLLGGKSIVKFSPIDPKLRLHPFEKPQELLQLLIRQSTNVGDVVLDPFAGSASTLVATKALNRNFIGYEISEKNYYLSLRRIKELDK